MKTRPFVLVAFVAAGAVPAACGGRKKEPKALPDGKSTATAASDSGSSVPEGQ
jgi:hypothetical protein